MEPAVSVIMPVRNGGAFLKTAVESILGQSFAALELILVDDHSDDSSIDRLCLGDSRLRVIKNTGSGVSSAFNTGFGQALGPLLARMDADDIALPQRIERQVAYLGNHPAVDLCGCCVEIFAEDGVGDGNLRYQAWLNGCRSAESIHREMFIESPIPNPTAMFRR